MSEYKGCPLSGSASETGRGLCFSRRDAGWFRLRHRLCWPDTRHNPMPRLQFAVALVLSALAPAAAQPAGALDLSFGTGGHAALDVARTSYEAGRAVAVQADGKTVVASDASVTSTGLVVSRYTADGLLDTSFGTGGHTGVGFARGAETHAVAVEQDGGVPALQGLCPRVRDGLGLRCRPLHAGRRAGPDVRRDGARRDELPRLWRRRRAGASSPARRSDRRGRSCWSPAVRRQRRLGVRPHPLHRQRCAGRLVWHERASNRQLGQQRRARLWSRSNARRPDRRRGSSNDPYGYGNSLAMARLTSAGQLDPRSARGASWCSRRRSPTGRPSPCARAVASW